MHRAHERGVSASADDALETARHRMTAALFAIEAEISSTATADT
jgi:hypothetical protein